jgi:hypothetical protein
MTVPIKGGKPANFSPEELDKRIEDYFNWVDDFNANLPEGEKKKPYTLSGICVYLDVYKEMLWEYSKKPEYSNTVKKAKQRVEQNVEEGSLNGKWNTIGAIFNLKNNFGWTDKVEVTTKEPEQLDKDDIKDKLKEIKDRNK